MPTPKPHRADGPLPFVPRGLRTQLAALYVGVHPSTWLAMVKRHEAPAPVYLTGRIPVWLREDLDRWGRALGRPLPDGHFGENLTTGGIDVNQARVGERWRVGTALLEVAKVRPPCRVFAGFLGVTGYDDTAWVKRFTAEGRPGPYLRVLEEGVVAAGDPIIVEHRPDHEVTVAMVFRALTTERDLLPRVLAVPELSDTVRTRRGGSGHL